MESDEAPRDETPRYAHSANDEKLRGSVRLLSSSFPIDHVLAWSCSISGAYF